MKLNTLAYAVAGAILTACSHSPECFTVQGELSDVREEGEITLERLDPGAGWVEMDKHDIDKSGRFEFESARPEHSGLYRLTYNGVSVYLPVDSTENFTLKAEASHFADGFTLTGTPQAEAMTRFEADVRGANWQNPDSLKALQRRVYDTYLKDARGNMLSYYILTRKVGDEYLVDYTTPLYWAVATQFQTYKPDDPHTKALAQRATAGQKAAGKGTSKTMEATHTGTLPITLNGTDGKKKALTDMLGHGKPVVVMFTDLSLEGSPELNMALRPLYESGRCDIYQVCLDSDQFGWMQAAKALPWTSVYEPAGNSSQLLRDYNVSTLPTFFIYDRSGDLVQRAATVAEIQRYL